MNKKKKKKIYFKNYCLNFIDWWIKLLLKFILLLNNNDCRIFI